MIAPQLFFVEAGIPDLRRIAKKYPAVRGLYDKKSVMRFMSVAEIFSCMVTTRPLKLQAKTAWAKSLVGRTAEPVVVFAELVLGVDRAHVSKGEILPTSGIGFAICPQEMKYTATVLLDDMRVLRWCKETAVPTFGVRRALADTILVHKEM